MATRLELVREELRLRWEIATHELRCLLDDGADADVIDEKFEECELIVARRDDLARRLARVTG
jgi:hypothetical protein